MCFVLFQEAVFSVAVEAAFPQCSIIRLGRKCVKRIRARLSSLRDGSAYAGDGRGGVGSRWVTSGSEAEGLAVKDGWGHPEADQDNMQLLGGPLGVHMPQGHHSPGRAVLRYRPEGCPPAYCKIEVTDVQGIIGVMDGRLDAGCVRRSKGVAWLHIDNTMKQIQSDSENISGPAGQLIDGSLEFVPALVCSDPHPDMDRNYLHRPRRGWPSSQQLEVIKQLPMLLVLTGHKLSHPAEIPLQARFSWSTSEMVLIMELPDYIKQVYIAVKYAFKRFLKVFRGSDGPVQGRSAVGSYYLKMALLYSLEKRPPTMIGSQLCLMHGLLSTLDGYLVAGNLPHYFLPNCDLLKTVHLEERRLARDVIQHILSDPLRAILTCPTNPEEVYGEVPPDTLVAAFHLVSSHPTCAMSREVLLGLLGRLDEERYELQFKDEPRELVGMLKNQL